MKTLIKTLLFTFVFVSPLLGATYDETIKAEKALHEKLMKQAEKDRSPDWKKQKQDEQKKQNKKIK